MKELVKEIVVETSELKDKHTDQKDALVNYACIFCQNEQEYNEFLESAQKIGEVVKEYPNGSLFKIRLETVAGELRLLKIRKPDPTRPERGDADFTVDNYGKFKAKYLGRSGFKLVSKESFEMIELMDSKFNVRVYFSYPTLKEILKK